MDGWTGARMPDIRLTEADVFGTSGDASVTFFIAEGWEHPVSFFVGRNGTGKSRTARCIAERANGRVLGTDRLSGLTPYSNQGWTSIPQLERYRGIPIGDYEREQAKRYAREAGTAIDEMYTLREQPEVWLRVAAFLRRALGRVIVLRETAGFFDPYIRLGAIDYSLLRDEGHGLRELVPLLTAIYREDWNLLIVDEPELHLHPAMTRLWLTELERVCRESGRRALVVTHEPDLIRPTKAEDLGALWLFMPQRPSKQMSLNVRPEQASRITASLQHNPLLVSQLVFSARPVLVEGVHDLAALTVALLRTAPPEVTAQTDLIECGGSAGVALWLEISRNAGLDVRAVADLDACLAPEVQRVMDSTPVVIDAYRDEVMDEPVRTSTVIRPLLNKMNEEDVPPDAKSRAAWLASDVPPETGWIARKAKLLDIWKRAGLWLHPQGTLESVLGGITEKGREAAELAARTPGPIDAVADWCAFDLDALGDVRTLLDSAVERIAHSIMEALRTDPGGEFHAPVGASAESDAKLVTIEPRGEGVHRLTVVKPEAFSGYWVDFSRDTPSSQLVLAPDPSDEA